LKGKRSTRNPYAASSLTKSTAATARLIAGCTIDLRKVIDQNHKAFQDSGYCI
jgi:hypothetical protein